MSYRPIGDIWWLARAKLKGGVKYYGAYLGGFPERARRLIGAPIDQPMLHVCGGMAKAYPYEGGFGKYDQTLDIDPALSPDFLQDAREPFPALPVWAGILMDPPYSEVDAEKYTCGRTVYPSPNKLVENALAALVVGRKVGIIHYSIPACPKNAKFVAMIGIACGFNNRIRAFSVYEKISEKEAGL